MRTTPQPEQAPELTRVERFLKRPDVAWDRMWIDLASQLETELAEANQKWADEFTKRGHETAVLERELAESRAEVERLRAALDSVQKTA